MKFTQQDIARIIGVDAKTLRNWRKDKPELYRRVMLSFQYEEILHTLKNQYEEFKKLGDNLYNK
ncbi:hypothetical protein [Helicobacter cappadocius]|uniref:Transcriptional regulator n=1 Tax=Helicobacter cappadocius TaxID=3063998 RepID=A0AA90PT31_9HELI|nr:MULTISPECIES: hypothetical protein [unclassified Helicobacter]MDO7252343.1 hypothetical protein [Helicobacter sp. faydin-H75]MDP2538210.1 hypothetical protein [Helicobacter sp. faydin-H76]